MLFVTFLASKITGVRLPSEKLRLLDIDLWIDLVLATDPAIVMSHPKIIADAGPDATITRRESVQFQAQASSGTTGPPGVRNGGAASLTSRTRSTQAAIATAM